MFEDHAYGMFLVKEALYSCLELNEFMPSIVRLHPTVIVCVSALGLLGINFLFVKVLMYLQVQQYVHTVVEAP